jgi:hypothetical protein
VKNGVDMRILDPRMTLELEEKPGGYAWIRCSVNFLPEAIRREQAAKQSNQIEAVTEPTLGLAVA